MGKSSFFTGQPVFNQLLFFNGRPVISERVFQYDAERYCKRFAGCLYLPPDFASKDFQQMMDDLSRLQDNSN